MTTQTDSIVTEAHRQQFEDEGYFLLEGIVSPEHLAALRAVCADEIARMDAEMEVEGVTVKGLNHKGSRYFIPFASRTQEPVRAFLFSELMADVCRATIGDEAFLFLDQYVVKAAETGMSFGWHQDGGYISYEHKPYLTCWITLDAVNEENGTVYILPYSQAGSKEYIPHIKDSTTNDMVGYHGDNPGIPVICPAGSIAVFGSNVFHRSGPNKTNTMRRIFLAQYAPEVILNHAGTAPLHLSDPFLHEGVNVAQIAL